MPKTITKRDHKAPVSGARNLHKLKDKYDHFLHGIVVKFEKQQLSKPANVRHTLLFAPNVHDYAAFENYLFKKARHDSKNNTDRFSKAWKRLCIAFEKRAAQEVFTFETQIYAEDGTVTKVETLPTQEIMSHIAGHLLAQHPSWMKVFLKLGLPTTFSFKTTDGSEKTIHLVDRVSRHRSLVRGFLEQDRGISEQMKIVRDWRRGQLVQVEQEDYDYNDVVDLLLSKQIIDPDQRASNGLSAVEYALSTGNVTLLAALLDNGASLPNISHQRLREALGLMLRENHGMHRAYNNIFQYFFYEGVDLAAMNIATGLSPFLEPNTVFTTQSFHNLLDGYIERIKLPVTVVKRLGLLSGDAQRLISYLDAQGHPHPSSEELLKDAHNAIRVFEKTHESFDFDVAQYAAEKVSKTITGYQESKEERPT